MLPTARLAYSGGARRFVQTGVVGGGQPVGVALDDDGFVPPDPLSGRHRSVAAFDLGDALRVAPRLLETQ